MSLTWFVAVCAVAACVSSAPAPNNPNALFVQSPASDAQIIASSFNEDKDVASDLVKRMSRILRNLCDIQQCQAAIDEQNLAREARSINQASVLQEIAREVSKEVNKLYKRNVFSEDVLYKKLEKLVSNQCKFPLEGTALRSKSSSSSPKEIALELAEVFANKQKEAPALNADDIINGVLEGLRNTDLFKPRSAEDSDRDDSDDSYDHHSHHHDSESDYHHSSSRDSHDHDDSDDYHHGSRRHCDSCSCDRCRSSSSDDCSCTRCRHGCSCHCSSSSSSSCSCHDSCDSSSSSSSCSCRDSCDSSSSSSSCSCHNSCSCHDSCDSSSSSSSCSCHDSCDSSSSSSSCSCDSCSSSSSSSCSCDDSCDSSSSDSCDSSSSDSCSCSSSSSSSSSGEIHRSCKCWKTVSVECPDSSDFSSSEDDCGCGCQCQKCTVRTQHLIPVFKNTQQQNTAGGFDATGYRPAY